MVEVKITGLSASFLEKGNTIVSISKERNRQDSPLNRQGSCGSLVAVLVREEYGFGIAQLRGTL